MPSEDVYQEKTMAFNPDHARRMRKAFEGSGRVVQPDKSEWFALLTAPRRCEDTV